jgi:hypothetical protein
MDKKNLFEELNRFKLLMNYNTSQTLTENKDLINDEVEDDDPFSDETQPPGKLKGGSNEKTGKLNMQGTINGVATYAVFRNKGFFPGKPKRQLLGIRTSSYATWYTMYEPKSKETPKTDNTKTPEPKIQSIDIDAKVEDPFVFDTTTLTTQAETSLTDFIAKIKNITNDYSPEIYSKYLEFIKTKKPIYVYSYASKDGNPDEKVQGKFSGCKGYGDGTRGQYDLCLSQKRAQYIVERLEKELPDLKGVFKGSGQGQTTKFNNIGWPTSKGPDETMPNRRFEIVLPSFSLDIPIPTPAVVTPPINQKSTVEKNSEKQRNKNMNWESQTFYWDISKYYPGIKENVVLPYKKENNSGFMMIKTSLLEDFFGGLDNFKKTIPNISGGYFYNDQYPNFVLNKSGVKVISTNGTFEWNFGGGPKTDKSYDYTAMENTEYKLTLVGVRGEYVLLSEMAFVIVEVK